MVHRRTAAIAVLWLLALGVGVGFDRLDAQSREALIAQGRQLFNDQACYGCHTVGSAGTPIAPDLARVGKRYPEATLAQWLRDPAAQRPTRHMPNLQLTEVEASAIAAFLASFE
jgi:mono/diheme cytochrome c family protein